MLQKSDTFHAVALLQNKASIKSPSFINNVFQSKWKQRGVNFKHKNVSDNKRFKTAFLHNKRLCKREDNISRNFLNGECMQISSFMPEMRLAFMQKVSNTSYVFTISYSSIHIHAHTQTFRF